MLGASDDIVLRRARKHVEERTVARHAHDQVLVALGVRLGIEQRLLADDVVLNMVTVQAVEERRDEHLEFLLVLLGRKHRRRHFLIEQHAAGDFIGRKLETVLNTAVGPCVSALCAGLQPSARGSRAWRPSGVAMVPIPCPTFALIELVPA